MKAQAVGYWICTVLIGLSFLSGGAVDLLRAPQALEGMTHLGYPAYFMTILGIWKVLGGARSCFQASPCSRSGHTQA